MKLNHLKNGLAVIGGFALILIALVLITKLIFFGNISDSTPRIDLSIASPDNQYLAVAYTFSGGGAGGWCSKDIAIIPTTKTIHTLKKEEWSQFEIYSGKCGSMPVISWESSKSIRVRLPNFVNPHGMSASLKGMDDSKKIQVYYQFCKANSYQSEC